MRQQRNFRPPSQSLAHRQRLSKALLSSPVLVFTGGFLGSAASQALTIFTTSVCLQLGLFVGNEGEYSLEYLTQNSKMVSLLVINLLGAAFLGFLAAPNRATSRTKFLFWGTGFCGALTTYSGFMWFLWVNASRSNWNWGAPLVAAAVMLILGFAAASMGWRISQRHPSAELLWKGKS